jgi:hypothetical protein
MKDRGMYYEYTMRLVQGEDAWHSAGEDQNPATMKDRFRKQIKKFLRQVANIDSTQRHQERLVGDFSELDNSWKGKVDPWSIIFIQWRIIARLLGYDYLKGARPYTPVYFQSENQRLTTDILDGNDTESLYDDRKNALVVRRNLVEKLSSDGLTTFQIALVFGVSEYEIKKLRRGV